MGEKIPAREYASVDEFARAHGVERRRTDPRPPPRAVASCLVLVGLGIGVGLIVAAVVYVAARFL